MNAFTDVIVAIKIFCRWKTIATWYDVVDSFFFDMADLTCIIISTLKTCFLIYLVEIACSWIAATADFIDLYRVEDFSYWLDRSLLTWGCWRYFGSCPWIIFLLSSVSSLLMRADLMVIFRGNFLMAANCWISWPVSWQYCCTFWWIDFSPQVTCQRDVSFRNCSSDFKS